MLFNLVFVNDTTWSCFFFFLINDFYLLIPAVIAQIFDAIAELVIPIEISSKEEKTETEIHLVTVEFKNRKCLI